MLATMRKENLPILVANAKDAGKDRNGSASNSLSNTLRFLGVAGYVLSHDIIGFKDKLSETARMRSDLFLRFIKGESISPSYVSMLSYKSLFNALAAGDLAAGRSLANLMGGRAEIEKEYDHAFDREMGYTLRAFVLADKEQMRTQALRFSGICEEPDNRDFRGYADLFLAVVAGDARRASEGTRALLKGHEKQCKGKAIFKDTEDEVLSVWGVGMVNLARMHGLSLGGTAPLIPEDLLL
jgi:hypothetical protein